MGFRKDAYATVWEISGVTNSVTRGRITISRKNKYTGQYETDFSGFVSFMGTAAAGQAIRLQPRDRIKLGDIDVSTNYDKKNNKEYTNYKIFSFETIGGSDIGSSGDCTPNSVSCAEDPFDTFPF